MSEQAAALGVLVVGIYLAVGVLFAVAFVLRGAGRIDPQAREGSWGFRLAILPGTAALWPLLAKRWLTGAGPPEERSPHRLRARGGPRGRPR